MREVRGDGSLRWLSGFMQEHEVAPNGVLHVGAHHGEEVPLYHGAGFRSIVLVEPDPANAAMIRRTYPDVPLVQAAAGGEVGRGYVDRSGGRSLGRTVRAGQQAGSCLWPVGILTVCRLQQPFPSNVLVLDTQGSELECLTSADLSTLDLVVTETDTLGQDASDHAAVVAYMATCEWFPVVRFWHGQHTYADVAFMRGTR